MASTPVFEPGPQWWEASALTTAPSLAILMTLIFNGRLHWFTKYQTIAAHYNFSLYALLTYGNMPV